MGRKSGVILNFITIFIDIFSALLLTPLIISSLGKSEYGVYTLMMSVTSYLGLLDLGIGQAVVKFMSKYAYEKDIDKQKKFLGIINLYYLIIGIIIVILGFLLVFLFSSLFSKGLTNEEIDLAKKLCIILTFNIAFTMMTAGYYYSVIAYQNFKISKGVLILFNLLRMLLTFILVYNGYKSITIVFINLIFTILYRGLIVIYVLLKMKIIPTLKDVDFKEIKEIIGFSFFILLQMIATHLNNMADQILIGALAISASTVLALYGVGSQINQYFQTFGGTINGVLMPGVVGFMMKDHKDFEVENEMARIGRMNLSFLGIIWIIFLLFGDQFMVLWAGEEYSDSYYVALILMFPQMIIMIQSICDQALWALNKHKTVSIIKFCIVILNILLTIILIKWNPLFGAVIGTFISLFIGDILLKQIIYKKELKLNLRYYYKKLFKGLFFSLVIALVSGALFKLINLNGIIGFLVNCLFVCLIYLICLMLFGFTIEEKQYIKSLIKKILRKA